MLHHTTISWSPEIMRRLILSVICSSGNSANAPNPTSLGIASSQIRITLCSRLEELRGLFEAAVERREAQVLDRLDHPLSALLTPIKWGFLASTLQNPPISSFQGFFGSRSGIWRDDRAGGG